MQNAQNEAYAEVRDHTTGEVIGRVDRETFERYKDEVNSEYHGIVLGGAYGFGEYQILFMTPIATERCR